MKRLLKYVFGMLAAAALALILGWGIYGLGKLYLVVIGRHAVLPQIETAPAPSAGEDKQVLHLDKFDLYYLQLGIFSHKENADNFARELEQKGVKVVVLSGQPYRVATGYYGQLSAASAGAAKLKGVKPVVKSQAVNGFSFRVTQGEGQDVKTVLINYAQILKDGATAFSSADPAALKSVESYNEKTGKLRADTVNAVKRLGSQSRGSSKETLLALDNQGTQLEAALGKLAGNKNGESYIEAQQTMLQLLNVYQAYLVALQNRDG